MSKSINFFATQSDLARVLSIVESDIPVKYVAAGMFDSSGVREFMSYNDITLLGVVVAEDQSHNSRFLVVHADDTVNVRPVPQRSGGMQYAVDQLLNPTSIVLVPGGVYENSCVIAGQAGTCTDDSASATLIGNFVKPIRKQFVRVRSYYVGSEAKRLLDEGYRLTVDAQRPSKYDLSITGKLGPSLDN